MRVVSSHPVQFSWLIKKLPRYRGSSSAANVGGHQVDAAAQIDGTGQYEAAHKIVRATSRRVMEQPGTRPTIDRGMLLNRERSCCSSLSLSPLAVSQKKDKSSNFEAKIIVLYGNCGGWCAH
eukprot:scaffold5875_cov162-Skeletonema_dohrnii-CCMP3373.AAC.1